MTAAHPTTDCPRNPHGPAARGKPPPEYSQRPRPGPKIFHSHRRGLESRSLSFSPPSRSSRPSQPTRRTSRTARPGLVHEVPEPQPSEPVQGFALRTPWLFLLLKGKGALERGRKRSSVCKGPRGYCQPIGQALQLRGPRPQAERNTPPHRASATPRDLQRKAS